MRALLILLAALSSSAYAFDRVEWVRREAHSPVAAARAETIVKAAESASRRHGIDRDLLLAVARQESGFRLYSTSVAGAKGVMQVIPKWHVEKIAGRDIHNPYVGFDVGAAVIAEYWKQARGDMRRALQKYSGGKPGYAKAVMTRRAALVMSVEMTHEKIAEFSRSGIKLSYNLPSQQITSKEKFDDNFTHRSTPGLRPPRRLHLGASPDARRLVLVERVPGRT